MTAVRILNKIPSSVLNGNTPYERLYGKPPTYDRMRTFGCLSFAANTKPHKDKFDTRSFHGIFLGYASGFKAYRIYDLSSHKLIVSRDVVFHKESFPFAEQ